VNPAANPASGPVTLDLLRITLSLLDEPKRESLDQASGLCRGFSSNPSIHGDPGGRSA
jgi:hypothetical protein